MGLEVLCLWSQGNAATLTGKSKWSDIFTASYQLTLHSRLVHAAGRPWVFFQPEKFKMALRNIIIIIVIITTFLSFRGELACAVLMWSSLKLIIKRAQGPQGAVSAPGWATDFVLTKKESKVKSVFKIWNGLFWKQPRTRWSSRRSTEWFCCLFSAVCCGVWSLSTRTCVC